MSTATIDLSVLVCSTHTRANTFGPAIQKQLWTQLESLPAKDQQRIEIIVLTDNKRMMLGHKRNIMVDMAQGRYVQFVDDDDRIDPDMFRMVLDGTDTNCDVITFLAAVSLNGSKPKTCHYSLDFAEDRNTAAGYERLPNHICAVKRQLSENVSYPNIAYGEDSGYAKLLRPYLKTEHHIPKILYHYDYNLETTEAQEHLRNRARSRPKLQPIVDVIVLSNASTPHLRRSTQKTVDSCIKSANSLPIEVTVMEQAPVTHLRCATLHMDQEFHYNRFANIGAVRGSADWILVANNDLTFRDGWLHQLLAAGHPFVSPKCPNDIRQRDITENTVGDVTGRHLSGWCLMISRDLFAEIDGFDESVNFWCSDDVVIEQTRAVGVLPMLVPAALVEHAESLTFRSLGVTERDDLTWKQLHIFIEKFGFHRLGSHPEYLRWKSEQT